MCYIVSKIKEKIILLICTSDSKSDQSVKYINIYIDIFTYMSSYICGCCSPFLTYELGRFSALEGALLSVSGALREVKKRRMDMVFVWQTTVHRLT